MAERIHKETKRINTELGNTNSRVAVLPKLKKLINHQNMTVLSENIINWLQTMCQLITLERNASAAEIVSLILSQACQVPSISRDISTKFIPNILDNFLKIEEKDAVLLQAMKTLLESYPTSCGSLRTHVVKTMIDLMMSSEDEDILDSAARCWALGASLGGAGHERSNHRQQEFDQFKDCVAAIKFSLDCFLGDEEGKIDSSIGSFSMTFPFLPVKEPERSDAIIKRTLAETTDILIQILDVFPSQLGNTTEMTYRAGHLSQIHEHVLHVFGMLTQICGKFLCSSSSAINNTFSALLDLWKDKSPVFGHDKIHCVIREKVYDAMSEWIKNCGATTRFMHGQTILNHNLLRHIIDDIKPVVGTRLVITNKLRGRVGSRTAKRRRIAEDTNLMNGNQVEQIINPTANEFLTSAALKVVMETVDMMGHNLPEEITRSLQNEVVSTFIQLRTSDEIIPYHRCTQPRLMLYKTLLSFVLTPSVSVAPPTKIANEIFTMAIVRESDSKIHSFCSSRISSFDNIVQSCRQSPHLYVPTNGVESTAFNGSAPLMEPMNVPEEEDMDEVEATAEQGTEPREHAHIDPAMSSRTTTNQQSTLKADKLSENKENIHSTVMETVKPTAIFQANVTDRPFEKTPDITEQTANDVGSIATEFPYLSASATKNSSPAVPIEVEDIGDELVEMMKDFVDASPDHE